MDGDLRPKLDRIVHERSRLMILTYLSTSSTGVANFTELKEGLGLTAGNLSVQLRNLEEVGYVDIEKSFVENRPNTAVGITELGRAALTDYLAEMEALIESLKKVT